MIKLYGSIEAGGTKFVCAIGDERFQIIEKIDFPTTTPLETIKNAVNFFKQYEKNLRSVSIGSFGPIDIQKESITYGYITKTPKENWSNVNLLGLISDHFSIPFYFTTDVNASAYGEIVTRSGIQNLVYYTIGTGLGAGIIQNGQFIGGIGHPEAGHVYVTRHPKDVEREFYGTCPFHKGCLEGLAAGPSLEARSGIRGELIDEKSEIWDIQAYYIAQAAVQATVLYRPEIIVFGGGVMSQKHMLQRVREQFIVLLNNYIPVPDVEDYIVTPQVAENGSATIGNFALAKKVLSD